MWNCKGSQSTDNSSRWWLAINKMPGTYLHIQAVQNIFCLSTWKCKKIHIHFSYCYSVVWQCVIIFPTQQTQQSLPTLGIFFLRWKSEELHICHTAIPSPFPRNAWHPPAAQYRQVLELIPVVLSAPQVWRAQKSWKSCDQCKIMKKRFSSSNLEVCY